ncbi:MAG: carboxypeptidase regulatory-like domain-containing protein [Dehalococcoidales bacterium]|nr:carboxypeptidase regulatory-like domain-containing protein [Dehalococcoidales bacterium]
MKKFVFRILLILSILASMSLPSAVAYANGNPATVEVNSGQTIFLPTGGSIAATDSSGIPIEVKNLPDLGAPENGFASFEFTLTWDPNVIQVDTVNKKFETIAPVASGGLGWIINVGPIHNDTGNVSVSGFLEGNFSNADITLFYLGITATASTDDSTPIDVTVLSLRDRYNSDIPQNPVPALVEIKNTATFTGIVLDELTAQPINNLRVYAENTDTGVTANDTYTGADGLYTLTVVPGTYIIRTDAGETGLWYADKCADNVSLKSQATAYTVKAGDTTDLNFTLLPGGTISGTVTDSTQTPVQGINVFASDVGTMMTKGDAMTDQDGVYVIRVTPGDYRVRAAPASSDQHYAGEFYNNTLNFNEATSVTVTLQTDTPNINFQLEPGGSISGTVISQDTQLGIGGVSVTGDQQDGVGFGIAVTDGDGNYITYGLPYGSYVVQSPSTFRFLANDANYVIEYYNEKKYNEPYDIVTIDAQNPDSVNIDFSLEEGSSISGIVYQVDGQTPIQGAWVNVHDYFTGDYLGNATTQADGSYVFHGLPTGQYRLNAYFTGYVREFWQETPLHHMAAPLQVNAPNDVTDINFTLELGGSISGTITDNATGQPLGGIDVGIIKFDTLMGWQQCYGTTLTNPDGTYTIADVPAGQYAVRAGATNGYILQYYQYAADQNGAVPVTINAQNDTPGIDFSLRMGGQITGTVTDSVTHLPVPNLHVYAVDFNTNVWYDGQQTDINGNYTLTVPQGTYKVRTSANTVQPYANEVYNGAYNDNYATPVPVTTGQATTNINFDLEPGGSISGRVTDNETGQPLAGFYVGTILFSTVTGYHECYGGAQTDVNGNYTIYGLPEGQYAVRANAWNGYIEQLYRYADDYTGAIPVTVTAAANTPNIDFSLEQGGVISGTVIDSGTQDPVPNLNVFATDYTTNLWKGSALTDVNGNYSFTVPAGTFRVRTCSTCSGLMYLDEYYDNTRDIVSAQQLTVAAHQTVDNINFSLDMGGNISGKVTDNNTGQPLAGIDVNIILFSTLSGYHEFYGGVKTDAEGNYTTFPLPEGQYAVRIDTANGYCLQYYQYADDQNGAVPVTVTADTNIPGIDFSLKAGGTITGTVIDSVTQQPIPNLHVHANDYDTNVWLGGTHTDVNGNYSLTVLPGSYRVRACPECSHQAYVNEYFDDETDYNSATPVQAVLSQVTPNIDFSLNPASMAGPISGYVYGPDGTTPLAGIQVQVFPAEDPWGLAASAQTNASGFYYISEIGVGNYKVRACPPATGMPYTTKFYNNTYFRSEATILTFTGTQTYNNINFTLESGGSISGRVYQQADDSPIEGAEVWAFTDTDTHGVAWTDASGNYTIRGLAAGINYKIMVVNTGYASEWYNDSDPDNYGPETATLLTVVPPGDIPNIDFGLLPGSSVSGHVFRSDGHTPLANAQITLYDEQDNAIGRAWTGYDGNYSLWRGAGLIPGNYTAVAQLGGFFDEWYNEKPFKNLADDIIVTAEQDITDIDFTLMKIIRPVVSVSNPPGAVIGGNLTAKVNIDHVFMLNAVQYDIIFNPAVLRLDSYGITDGLLDSTVFPVPTNEAAPYEIEPGHWRIVQTMGTGNISGAGYLCQLNFEVIGSPGSYSDIKLKDGILSGMFGEIGATWLNNSINTVVQPGDANGDGVINIFDITRIARIILELDPPTPGADANRDGSINVLDMTVVARIILQIISPVPPPEQYGGELVILANSDISVWNPGATPCSSVSGLEGIVLEQLLTTDWLKGPAGTGETNYIEGPTDFSYVLGNLVESWSTPSIGVWVLNIRQGVHFGYHPGFPASELVGGREMTADDVVASILYMKNNPTSASRCSEPTLMTNLTVEKTGPWQVTVTTPVAPATGYLWIMGGGGVQYIWPEEFLAQYATSNDWHDVVGTGPYILNDYRNGYGARYFRNRNYWDTNPVGTDAGEQLPYPAGMKYLVVPDTETRIALLKTGLADWSSVDQFRSYEYQEILDANPNIQSVETILDPLKISGRVDLQDNPFSDIRIRKAMMLAIDHQGLKDTYYGGHAEILDSPARKYYTSIYTPLNELPATTQELYGYDPVKAKQLLAEAGYPNGFKIDMVLMNDNRSVQEAYLLRQYMAAIGIALELQVLEPTAFIGLWVGHQYENLMLSVYNGGTGALFVRYGMGYYRGPNIFNMSHVNDPPGTDATIEQAYNDQCQYVMVDYPQADAVTKTAYQYILSQAFLIPMPAPYGYRVWQPWLKNYHGEGALKHWLKYAWIDIDMKASMQGWW